MDAHTPIGSTNMINSDEIRGIKGVTNGYGNRKEINENEGVL